jgi:uncharacterized membrane-anchored protein
MVLAVIGGILFVFIVCYLFKKYAQDSGKMSIIFLVLMAIWIILFLLGFWNPLY